MDTGKLSESMRLFFGWKRFQHHAQSDGATGTSAKKENQHLIIDWEAQFSYTIEYVERMRAEYSDITERFFWIALPLTTQNGLSQFSPTWQCWQPGVEWVRQPPEHAITDPAELPFYQHGMTFESFVSEFADWFANHRPAAMMIGIRADESYNAFRR